MSTKSETITVCDSCENEECWQGKAYCENYRKAGTKQVPAYGVIDKFSKQRISPKFTRYLDAEIWAETNAIDFDFFTVKKL